jgi:uncharacterized protein with PIN domain
VSAREDDHLRLSLHGDLKDLLHRRYRQDALLHYPLSRSASIKDILEAVGIPHTEIGAIYKGALQLAFNYLPLPGDQLEIYGVTAGPAAAEPSVLRPRAPGDFRFLVDINIARLAGLLRMTGFDTVSVRDLPHSYSKRDIARKSRTSGRILLSRDKELLKHREVAFGRLVRTQDPTAQLIEIVRFYGLRSRLAPFSRCLKCNGLLAPVSKETVVHRLEPLTKRYYHSFRQCGSCSSIYWRGSHHERMLQLLEPVLTDDNYRQDD